MIRHELLGELPKHFNVVNRTVAAHPGHVYPSLQQPSSLVGLQRRVAQAGGDDTVGDGVELGHGGSDSRGQVLLPLLVSLRPNPPQAVVGHHLLKQILDGGKTRQDTLLIHASMQRRAEEISWKSAGK